MEQTSSTRTVHHFTMSEEEVEIVNAWLRDHIAVDVADGDVTPAAVTQLRSLTAGLC